MSVKRKHTRSASLGAALATTCAGLACGETVPAPPPTIYEPLGSTHVTPPGTGAPDTRPPPLEEAPEEARRFAAAVRALDENGRADHAAIVVGLRRLADALAVVGPSRTDLIEVVRSSADELESSPAHADTHADLVRRAFDAAHLVALSGSPRDRWDLSEYLASVRELYDAKQLVDPDRPLLEQHRQVARAFDAALEAIETALGQPLTRRAS